MISNGRFKPYHSIYITSSRRQTAKQEFISEVTVGELPARRPCSVKHF